jgi:hypothetical protein
MPALSPARTAPAIESAACAASPAARALSSGVTRSRAAVSASAPSVCVSASWRTRNRATTPAAASSTTRKAERATLTLKLAAFTLRPHARGEVPRLRRPIP